ncbi:MAG: type VI secretion system Vgr family protein [Myxococcota bacterium]
MDTTRAPSQVLHTSSTLPDLQRADQADLSVSLSALPDEPLRVLRLTGREAVQQLFEFELELVSPHDDLPLEQVLGTRVVLTIRGPQGARTLTGVAEAFELTRVGRRWTHYRLCLRPSMISLLYRQHSRIFRGLSTPEVVQKVFQQAGFSSDTWRLALENSYAPRDFCVQYQETDLHFVTRLLEREGITFYFEHVECGQAPFWQDVLVLSDGKHGFDPLPPGQPLIFRDEARASVQQSLSIYHLEARARLSSSQVRLRDYRFKQSDRALEQTHQGAGQAGLEVELYPGGFVEPSVGSRLARLRQEALAAERLRIRGEATYRSLQPGYHFALELHPRPDFNRHWLLLEVEHEAQQPQALEEEAGAEQVVSTSYRVRFECQPLEHVYRPPSVTSRPHIAGVQTGRVVGPKDAEIHCDAYGRVLVQFHWDRFGQHGDLSCWVRVGRPWAGQGYGFDCIPRIGQEVLVQFLEGDPERPVIVGSVHNDRQSSALSLPEEQSRARWRTRSTPGSNGYNELSFEDRVDQEEVYLRAQRDLQVEVLRREHRHIGQDALLEVGGQRAVLVEQDALEQVQGQRRREVQGSESISIEGDRELTVKGDCGRQVLVGDDMTVIENGKQHIMVQKDRVLTVRSGHHLTFVEQGDCKLLVQGSHDIQVEEGNATYRAASGNLELEAARSVIVQAGETLQGLATQKVRLEAGDSLSLKAEQVLTAEANQSLSLTAGESAALEAQEIYINAGKKLVLKAGASELRLEQGGIQIKGLKLELDATSLMELKAALIKAN